MNNDPSFAFVSYFHLFFHFIFPSQRKETPQIIKSRHVIIATRIRLHVARALLNCTHPFILFWFIVLVQGLMVASTQEKEVKGLTQCTTTSTTLTCAPTQGCCRQHSKQPARRAQTGRYSCRTRATFRFKTRVMRGFIMRAIPF